MISSTPGPWHGWPESSRLVRASATSQRKSANPSDGDSRSRGPGQYSHGAGECGTRVDEILWREAEEMRHGANESRERKGLSQELRDALEPLLREIESLNERIAEYDRRIEQIAKEDHPEVARAETSERCGDTDRVNLRSDLGRSLSISPQPGCRMLSGVASRAQKFR